MAFYFMQIHRDRSRLTFQSRRRRRSGCLPMTLAIGILIAAVLASWDWIGQRLGLVNTAPISGDLSAATRAFDEGNLDSAINLTQQIWSAHPEQTEALTLLTRALIYRSYTEYNRDVDRFVALKLTQDAYERTPDDLNVMAAHAFALQAADEPVLAEQFANTVLRRQPTNAMARVALALSYASVGGYENALREGQSIVDAQDLQVDVLRAIAISLNDLGRYEDAITVVDSAIQINDKLLALHFERALYALQIGDADAATASYFRILAYDPGNIKARLRMCELSSVLRERETAVQYCKDVTERAPGWADGWYRLGREYFLQGDFRAAQESLHRCTTLHQIQNTPIAKRPFECWYLQGQAAEVLGDCPGLLETYNDFREMAALTSIPETWTYPPEGPSICVNAPPGT
jgi:tetratricopeptide (TPR) repeat protein